MTDTLYSHKIMGESEVNTMYCRNCGEQYVSDAAVMCVKCGVQKGVGRNYCPNCGQPTTPESVVCLNCGISLSGNNRAAGGTGDYRVHEGHRSRALRGRLL